MVKIKRWLAGMSGLLTLTLSAALAVPGSERPISLPDTKAAMVGSPRIARTIQNSEARLVADEGYEYVIIRLKIDKPRTRMDIRSDDAYVEILTEDHTDQELTMRASVAAFRVLGASPDAEASWHLPPSEDAEIFGGEDYALNEATTGYLELAFHCPSKRKGLRLLLLRPGGDIPLPRAGAASGSGA